MHTGFTDSITQHFTTHFTGIPGITILFITIPGVGRFHSTTDGDTQAMVGGILVTDMAGVTHTMDMVMAMVGVILIMDGDITQIIGEVAIIVDTLDIILTTMVIQKDTSMVSADREAPMSQEMT